MTLVNVLATKPFSHTSATFGAWRIKDLPTHTPNAVRFQCPKDSSNFSSTTELTSSCFASILGPKECTLWNYTQQSPSQHVAFSIIDCE